MVDESWLGLSTPPSPKSPYQPQAGLIGNSGDFGAKYGMKLIK